MLRLKFSLIIWRCVSLSCAACKPLNPTPETRTPRTETGIPNHESRNRNPETRITKTESRNLRNLRDPKPETSGDSSSESDTQKATGGRSSAFDLEAPGALEVHRIQNPHPKERLVIYCQTTRVSAAHATHCATYCTPCRPLTPKT